MLEPNDNYVCDALRYGLQTIDLLDDSPLIDVGLSTEEDAGDDWDD